MKKTLIACTLILVFLNCEKIEFKQTESMAKQTIGIGSAYDDPSADKARDAFDKVNDNFTEVYDDLTLLNSYNSNDEFVKILAIGTWNMDTGSDFTVAWNKPTGAMITHIEAIIIADDAKTQRSISYPISATGLPSGYAYYDQDEAGIYIEREDGSIFDGAAYDGSSNRGYVRIAYIIP
jgi:hypothetical protein